MKKIDLQNGIKHYNSNYDAEHLTLASVYENEESKDVRHFIVIEARNTVAASVICIYTTYDSLKGKDVFYHITTAGQGLSTLTLVRLAKSLNADLSF